MNIAIVAPRCCVRVLKQAEVLYNKGYKLFLITERNIKRPFFEAILIYDGVKQLENALKLVKPIVDLFHVHNEPSYPVTVIRGLFPNAKIVLDMHDSHYWRYPVEYRGNGIRFYEEDIAVDCADAFVFVSDACKKSQKQIIGKRPSTVLWCTFPMSYLRYEPEEFRGGLVSNSGHTIPNGAEGDNYRDYTDLYKQVIKSGKLVYAYSPVFTYQPKDEIDKYYIQLGCKLGCFKYHDLLDILGSHTWSLVGNIDKHPVWQYSLPNKFFDAIAAGTPSVNFGCPEVAKIIDKYDIGINVGSVDELIERWDEHQEKRRNLILCRKKLSMEKQIPKLEKLYEELIS